MYSEFTRVPAAFYQSAVVSSWPFWREYVFKLDAIGVREENRIITGGVIGVINRWIQNDEPELFEQALAFLVKAMG